jgi:hypothetical protein
MSKYGVTQTVLREEKYLVEALKEMGYEVEVHPEGAQLNSYYAEQEAKAANIILRRQHLPPSSAPPWGLRRYRLCPSAGRSAHFDRR